MRQLKKIVKEILSLPFGWLILFLLFVIVVNFIVGFNFLDWLFRQVLSLFGITYRIPSDANTKPKLKAWVDQMAVNNEKLSIWEYASLWVDSITPWNW